MTLGPAQFPNCVCFYSIWGLFFLFCSWTLHQILTSLPFCEMMMTRTTTKMMMIMLVLMMTTMTTTVDNDFYNTICLNSVSVCFRGTCWCSLARYMYNNYTFMCVSIFFSIIMTVPTPSDELLAFIFLTSRTC